MWTVRWGVAGAKGPVRGLLLLFRWEVTRMVLVKEMGSGWYGRELKPPKCMQKHLPAPVSPDPCSHPGRGSLVAAPSAVA